MKKLIRLFFFAIDPNLILVKNVESEEILRCVDGLVRQKYFDSIRPVDIDSLDLTKLVKVHSNR
jgi:hypothetical protein